MASLNPLESGTKSRVPDLQFGGGLRSTGSLEKRPLDVELSGQGKLMWSRLVRSEVEEWDHGESVTELRWCKASITGPSIPYGLVYATNVESISPEVMARYLALIY